MDPDENLRETRVLSEKIIKELDLADVLDPPGIPADDADRICTLARSLDDWIMHGGFLPKEWAEKAAGGVIKRAELAIRVYDEVFGETESFEGPLGVQLAYLLAAILKGTHIQLSLKNIEENEVHQFFQILFPEGHPVWAHVKVVDS